jgi:hypothetical protein
MCLPQSQLLLWVVTNGKVQRQGRLQCSDDIEFNEKPAIGSEVITGNYEHAPTWMELYHKLNLSFHFNKDSD